MQELINNQQLLTLHVTDGVAVGVIQDPRFEFLMSTKDVALGYGVAEATIRSHKNDQRAEIKEGVHFVPSVGITNARGNLQTKQNYWTKAGVIRLGMFIRSERAKLFRDWAEQIILKVTAPVVALPHYQNQTQRAAHCHYLRKEVSHGNAPQRPHSSRDSCH
ncbi:MAG: Bro-N domain-containing protein [Spirosomaceae bacterium]|nr:Bro-N domain-containing protein [Spirosomataceae bacterium]